MCRFHRLINHREWVLTTMTMIPLTARFVTSRRPWLRRKGALGDVARPKGHQGRAE
jgi:hypothetical protein